MNALYLNRTIVMPPFFKHNTDPSTKREGYLYQDPQEKLDGEEIAKLMPVITLEEYSEKCHHGLDVAFLARATSNTSEVKRLGLFEKILDFPIIKRPYNLYDQVFTAPTVINPDAIQHRRQQSECYIQMTKESAMNAYGPEATPDSNDGKCALWVEPYRNMMILDHLEFWSGQTGFPTRDLADSNSLLDHPAELAARMMEATCRSKSVRSAASEFIEVVFEEVNFVAMHWRYSRVWNPNSGPEK